MSQDSAGLSIAHNLVLHARKAGKNRFNRPKKPIEVKTTNAYQKWPEKHSVSKENFPRCSSLPSFGNTNIMKNCQIGPRFSASPFDFKDVPHITVRANDDEIALKVV
jgi:hypothetical protein